MPSRAGIAKVHESGAGCRVCGQFPVEAAHLVHRSRGAKGFNDPDLVVGLCRGHHALLDSHRLELLPHLTYDEQAAAVKIIGIVRAVKRLAPGARIL
jgi:hypothetical protein